MFLHVGKNPPLTKYTFDQSHIKWDNDENLSLIGALYLSTLFYTENNLPTSNWIEYVIRKNGVYEYRDFDPKTDNPYDKKIKQANKKYEEVKNDTNINEACRKNNLKQIEAKLIRLVKLREQYIDYYTTNPYKYRYNCWWKRKPVRIMRNMDKYKWVAYTLSDNANILNICLDNIDGIVDKYCQLNSTNKDDVYVEKILYEKIKEEGYDGLHLKGDLFHDRTTLFEWFCSEQLIVWNWCFDESKLIS